jgi:hypothetical protein
VFGGFELLEWGGLKFSATLAVLVSWVLAVGGARVGLLSALVLSMVDCDLGAKAGRNSWWGDKNSGNCCGQFVWGTEMFPGGPRKTLSEMDNAELVIRIIAFSVICGSMIAVGVVKLTNGRDAIIKAFYIAFMALVIIGLASAYYHHFGELVRRNRKGRS